MVPYKQFSSADIFDDVQKLLPTFIPKYEQHLNSSMFLIKMSNKLSKFCNYLNFGYSIAHNRIGHVMTRILHFALFGGRKCVLERSLCGA